MSTSELFLAVGLLIFLIATPLVVAVLVRIFVRDTDEPDAAEPEIESAASFESLGDFWAGMAPHLRELRDRLVKSLAAIAIGTAVGFWIVSSPTLLGERLPDLLISHFVPPGVKLQYVAAAEGFVNYMRVALVIGIAIAVPVVVYQLIAFFAPGLLPHEKRIVFTALPFVTELFLAGLTFGWFFTIPAALQFLLTFGTSSQIESRPSFESFISIVSTLMLWNGVIFELPAVIYLLARIGVVTAKTLGRTRRYAIVIITIAAAIITPTGDPFNLLLLAVPMYLLYELGILLARFVPARGTPGEGSAPLRPA
jgi:sec-independent protein translocase protein TatC